MWTNKTERYYRRLSSYMAEHGLPQEEAEQALLAVTVMQGLRAGLSHNAIAKRLTALWGWHRTTYFRRIEKLRRTICIP